MAENGADGKSEPLLGSERPSEDLFPHLEALVPPDLSTCGVIAEAFRLVSHHFKLFLLPIVVLTVQACLGLGFRLWAQSPVPAWGLSIPSSLARTTALHAQDYDGSAWAGTLLGVVTLLLTAFAEAAFDQAAVGAYLQESYGPDQAPASTAALLLATLRAVATDVAVLVTTAGLGLAAAIAGFLALALLNSVLPAYDAAGTVSAAVAFVLVVIVVVYLTVVLIVAAPAAVVSKEWGFEAARRSFRLTAGSRAAAFKLVLLSFAAGVALSLIPALGVTEDSSKAVVVGLVVAAGACGWIVNLGWILVRVVLYLKFRAYHKIAVKHVGV